MLQALQKIIVFMHWLNVKETEGKFKNWCLKYFSVLLPETILNRTSCRQNCFNIISIISLRLIVMAAKTSLEKHYSPSWKSAEHLWLRYFVITAALPRNSLEYVRSFQKAFGNALCLWFTSIITGFCTWNWKILQSINAQKFS